MRSVRIYKDDIRTHILRSLFFTDTALVITGSLVIAGIWYVIFASMQMFNWAYYLSALFVSIIFFFAFITQKVDNQAIYKVVPRAVSFQKSRKELRTKDIDPYFVQFELQENYIIKNNLLIQVYEVSPFDIALLNEQDRENFFVKLKQTIHTLPRQIQFIVKKERATSKDYSEHFFSLYKDSSPEREELIREYIENITDLVDSNNLMITKHYVVISVPCNPKSSESKESALKKHFDLSSTLSANLSLCQISMRQLDMPELVSFVKAILR